MFTSHKLGGDKEAQIWQPLFHNILKKVEIARL